MTLADDAKASLGVSNATPRYLKLGNCILLVVFITDAKETQDPDGGVWRQLLGTRAGSLSERRTNHGEAIRQLEY